MSDSVQQIKDKLSIIDVISPYVELHKAGKNFKGKSPFSAENTPSFYVSPDRGMYYCFSTSQGGDMFTFVQAMEGVDFKGALTILADKAGVELVPEDPKKRSERERLYAAMEAATVFYTDWLERHAAAGEYLAGRGVTPQTVAKWRIGYAPGPPQYGWRETKSALEAKKYTKDELLKAGIIKEAQGGKEPFDVFRDRIVFPMSDPSGRVVAFSGRLLTKDSEAPKYVNSPETQLYKKSELLFGYDKAKEGIRKFNFSLIVEGQFDVVMCHQAGYSNTVAVSGTALTTHHVQLLERLSDKVVLALDADRAGITAMKKGAAVMLARGLDVKVAALPDGQDPADMISNDVTQFKLVIGGSMHVVEFLVKTLQKQIPDERQFLLRVKEEVYPLAGIPHNRTDRYTLAKLISTQTDMPVDVVWQDMEEMRVTTNTQASTAEFATSKTVDALVPSANGQAAHERAYTYLLGALAVLDESEKGVVETVLADIATIASAPEIDDSDLTAVVFMLEQQFADMPTLAKHEDITARLNQYRVGVIRRELQAARKMLGEAETAGDEDGVASALQQIQAGEAQLRKDNYTAENLFGEKS